MPSHSWTQFTDGSAEIFCWISYFRKAILKPRWNMLPYPGLALGSQASHIITSVSCFCPKAEACPCSVPPGGCRHIQRRKGKGRKGRKRNRWLCGKRILFRLPLPPLPWAHCVSQALSWRQPGRHSWCWDGRDQVQLGWLLTPLLASSAVLYAILPLSQPPGSHLWNGDTLLRPFEFKDPLNQSCENTLQSVRPLPKCEASLLITIWQMQSLVLLTQLSSTALGNLDFADKQGKGGNICL